MKSDLSRAKELLNKGGYTCVLCKGGSVFASKKRGVAPLADLVDSGRDFCGFSAADKIVGRAAAFLYIKLGAHEVYAEVMSEGAAELLTRYGVKNSCGTKTEMIINREGTGICPMELAVKSADEPDEALAAIMNAIKLLEAKKHS